MTQKQIDLLRELSQNGGIDEIFGAVELVLGAEWRAGIDAEAREGTHAKHMALVHIRREIRKVIGADDG